MGLPLAHNGQIVSSDDVGAANDAKKPARIVRVNDRQAAQVSWAHFLQSQAYRLIGICGYQRPGDDISRRKLVMIFKIQNPIQILQADNST